MTPFELRNSAPARNPRLLEAFSLVELLVVLAVIAVLMGVSVPSLQGIANGSGVRGAVSLTSSALEHARLEALRHGAGARLVIDADPSSDGYLRRIAVLGGQRVGSGVEWELKTRPQYLPENTFFYEDFSGGFGTMSVDFRGAGGQTGSAGTEVFYFEYDSNGRLMVPSGSTGLSQAIFVAGTLSGGQLDVPESRESSRDGFILRRAGNATYFDAPDQIKKP